MLDRPFNRRIIFRADPRRNASNVSLASMAMNSPCKVTCQAPGAPIKIEKLNTEPALYKKLTNFRKSYWP